MRNYGYSNYYNQSHYPIKPRSRFGSLMDLGKSIYDLIRVGNQVFWFSLSIINILVFIYGVKEFKSKSTQKAFIEYLKKKGES